MAKVIFVSAGDAKVVVIVTPRMLARARTAATVRTHVVATNWSPPNYAMYVAKALSSADTMMKRKIAMNSYC